MRSSSFFGLTWRCRNVQDIETGTRFRRIFLENFCFFIVSGHRIAYNVTNCQLPSMGQRKKGCRYGKNYGSGYFRRTVLRA